jgi:hypothetical protein
MDEPTRGEVGELRAEVAELKARLGAAERAIAELAGLLDLSAVAVAQVVLLAREWQAAARAWAAPGAVTAAPEAAPADADGVA